MSPHSPVPGPRPQPLADGTHVFISPSPRTVLFNTTHKPWAEVIPCGYEMQHSLRDLVPLKAFLLAGTTVTIVEEKVGRWSQRPPSTGCTSAPFLFSSGRPPWEPRSLVR